MLDGRFMSPFVPALERQKRASAEGVMLLLRVKQRCLCLRDYKYCLHHALYLMQLSVTCNLISMGHRLVSDP